MKRFSLIAIAAIAVAGTWLSLNWTHQVSNSLRVGTNQTAKDCRMRTAKLRQQTPRTDRPPEERERYVELQRCCPPRFRIVRSATLVGRTAESMDAHLDVRNLPHVSAVSASHAPYAAEHDVLK